MGGQLWVGRAPVFVDASVASKSHEAANQSLVDCIDYFSFLARLGYRYGEHFAGEYQFCVNNISPSSWWANT